MESDNNGQMEFAGHAIVRGQRRRLLVLFFSWVALLAAACSSITLPHDPAAMEPGPRRTIVLVPGMTGIELVNRQSGKRAWPIRIGAAGVRLNRTVAAPKKRLH